MSTIRLLPHEPWSNLRAREGSGQCSCNVRGKSFSHEPSLSFVVWVWCFVLWVCCFVLVFNSKPGLGNGGGGVCKDSQLHGHTCYVGNDSRNSSNRLASESGSCANCNTSNLPRELRDCNQSLPKENEIDDILRHVIGYASSVCKVESREERPPYRSQHLPNSRVHQPNYLNLDEFRNSRRKEKVWQIPTMLVNITHRLELDGTEYNYASGSKGAKVIAHNKEAKGADNIIGRDHDKYLRNPCSARGKFVVIELAEETLVDAVKIANFEHYSSNFKEFKLWGSLSYPAETWTELGKFVAENVKHIQSFKLPQPKWLRYLKLDLLSHYGSEFYCTLSVLEVCGIDEIERMIEDLFVASSKTSSPVNLLKPNTTGASVSRQGPDPVEIQNDDKSRNKVDAAAESTGEAGQAEGHDIPVVKDPIMSSNIPESIMEVKQMLNGRIPGDHTVLKLLLKKVRSLELNLSVLEEYIKELNQRHLDMFPDMDKEMSRIWFLLEKTEMEIRDIMEWKKLMEKGVDDLVSWKSTVSSLMDVLSKENSMLRSDIEKVARDQASLKNKELAVLGVSFFFFCCALVKLVATRPSLLFRASRSEKALHASRGWLLILVSSSVTMCITLLFS